MKSPDFHFREFSLRQVDSPARIGTDGVLLGAWVDGTGARRILDVGTGTGVIALMLAQRCPGAQVDALEIHPGAAAEAAVNFARSPWSDRLVLRPVDAGQFTADAPYDLIVSNPPYFRGEVGSASPDGNRRSWRTQQTLTADSWMGVVARNLRPEGRWAVVVPVEDRSLWVAAAGEAGWQVRRELRLVFMRGKSVRRVLLECHHGPERKFPEEMTLQVGGTKEYSEAAQTILRPFYPWMD